MAANAAASSCLPLDALASASRQSTLTAAIQDAMPFESSSWTVLQSWTSHYTSAQPGASQRQAAQVRHQAVHAHGGLTGGHVFGEQALDSAQVLALALHFCAQLKHVRQQEAAFGRGTFTAFQQDTVPVDSRSWTLRIAKARQLAPLCVKPKHVGSKLCGAV